MEGCEARLGGRILRIDGGELESDMVEYLMDQAVQELEKLDAQEIKASTDLRTGTFSHYRFRDQRPTCGAGSCQHQSAFGLPRRGRRYV